MQKTIEWLENEHTEVNLNQIESLLTFLRKNHDKLSD